MLLLMDGRWILSVVAALFAECFRFLNMPLFTFGSRNISLWNICLSLLMISIFRDFLDILGIWGYSEDEVSYNDSFED